MPLKCPRRVYHALLQIFYIWDEHIIRIHKWDELLSIRITQALGIIEISVFVRDRFSIFVHERLSFWLLDGRNQTRY